MSTVSTTAWQAQGREDYELVHTSARAGLSRTQAINNMPGPSLTHSASQLHCPLPTTLEALRFPCQSLGEEWSPLSTAACPNTLNAAFPLSPDSESSILTVKANNAMEPFRSFPKQLSRDS